MRQHRHLDKPVVFAAALLVAVGGLIYELILGTAASYLFGDSIVSFSIATGMTLFGMGIGSLLAARLSKNPGLNFARNELILSLLGGNSVLLLFAAFSTSGLYWLVFVLLSLGIGITIGIEIPLLVGLLKEFGKKSSIELLSKVMAADYFGALIASLLFPFLLLPHLGLTRTAYAVALLNAGVAFFILWRLKALGNASKRLTMLGAAVVALLLGSFIFATRIERALDSALFKDPVVYYEFTPYQKIVMTQFKEDTRLYLSDQLQFSSIDEVRYHETLAHSALTSVTSPRSVLILGGGDGLLAREVLKYESVQRITLVDIDPAMTNLAKTNRILQDLNHGALLNPKVTIQNQDAFQFVRSSQDQYDAVLIDLIDPSNERISKLYSRQFYEMIHARLTPVGVLITQATSTYFTPNAFWQINDTIQAAQPERDVIPLSQNIPSFGEWGFLLSLPPDRYPFTATPLPSDLKYHSSKSLALLTNLPTETANSKNNHAASTLLNPDIYRTYRSDMTRWNY